MGKSFDDIIKGAFAYNPPDGEPKLPIHDAKHVAMAAAALSSGGFRGQKVQIPSDAVAGVKAKVRAAWRKFNPDKDESEMPASIRKDASGGDPDGDGDGSPVPPKKKGVPKKRTVPQDDDEQDIDGADEQGTEDYDDDEEGDVRDGSTSTKKRFDVQMVVKIEKLDAPNRTVYGWASVSTVNGVELEDLQSDVISVDEIRRAAHDFMMNSRAGGEMHMRKNAGNVVESIIVDNAVKKALGMSTALEGWFIGYKVTDPNVWQDVESGKYRAFSIGGSGVRVPEDEE